MTTYSLTGITTLMELSTREHNGMLMPIVNVLSQENEMLLDAQWAECNNRTSYKGIRAATEPTGTLRQYNEGIDPETGTTTPFTEDTCMLDGLSKVDSALLRHSSNALQDRLDRDRMFIRGMQKTMQSNLIYSTKVADNDDIDGFLSAARDYAALSSDYVYDNAGGDASATANKMSILIVGWGVGKTRLIYPRNDAPGGQSVENPDVEGLGIKIKDFGEDLILDTNSKEYPGYRTWLEMHFGLMIEDPRYIRRICNISATNIDGDDDFGFNEDYLIDAVNDMPDLAGAAIYIPRLLRAQIWKRVKDKGNVNFTMDKDPFGRPMSKFLEIPIRLVDKMVATEATVS